MISCIGHSIVSPLACGSQANMEAVLAGRSAARLYIDHFESVEPFYASLFEQSQSFVPLCIQSAEQALEQAQIDPFDPSVVFIISTTKGDNLDLLTPSQSIARHFGNPNEPIVVSNACTSGVCAQITAMRLLEAQLYKTAIVIGCDIQSRFIVSGFQAFKALSPEACRPFDAERKGLNLGEAASTIIWTTQRTSRWHLSAGSIHNDANHLSAPSRTGEGAYQCLMDVLSTTDRKQLAFIGVHGTATLYNDEMESIALRRAGLDELPICALKGYYGHTMGAAGIVETILGMLCVEQHILPSVKGYATCGTSVPLCLPTHNQHIQGNQFVKMLSGFGGTNAAILLTCE